MPEHRASGLPHPPTIRDVAREAGVSIATVSHALSGKRPVSKPTLQRIEAASLRLGYRPNHVAASMVTGRTRTLGLVVPDIGNPFFSELVRAVEGTALTRGYTLVVGSSELTPALEDRYVDVFRDKRVDALIYLPGTPRENARLSGLAAAGVPLVVLDEPLPTLPPTASLLTVDNRLGGLLAARHLLELGHRAIGIIGGPRGLPTAAARVLGFRHAARGAGAPVVARRLRHADTYTLEAGRDAARYLLIREAAITALFCVNDLIALGAMQAARELGRNVPAELSIVGFDDIFVAALVTPALTTVRQPVRRLGREAAELAIDLVEGRTAGPARRVLPVELRLRQSTARPAAPARRLELVRDAT